MPEQYLRGRHAPLVLTVALQRRDASPRWKEIAEPAPGRFTHHLELHSAAEVDGEVRRWLCEAWEAAAQRGQPPFVIWRYRSAGEGAMDEDLERMSREELIAEVKKLRQGVRVHRDSTGHELCWHHPALWALLPERQDPLPTVPEWPQFMRGCIRYRQSLDEQLPHAPRSDEPYGERP